MESNKAIIFDIQKYSLHDGPGIRTIVFLKGCPLKCLWCCNPESQFRNIEVEFIRNKCISCGRCLERCKQGAIIFDNTIPYRIDKSKCINCGECVESCFYGAMKSVGKWMSVSEMMEIILRDKVYYTQTGGGITFSGGEPLTWPEFMCNALKQCYDRNINTAIETTGYVNRDVIKEVAKYTDLFLYDVKSINSDVHKKMTGVSNELILDNLEYLRALDKDVIIRVPLIPEVNLNIEQLSGIMELAHDLNITEVHLMPYHNFGEIKYEQLSRKYKLQNIKVLKNASDFDKQMKPFKHVLHKYKEIKVKIGG